jgi:valyl-tRNA synthetase
MMYHFFWHEFCDWYLEMIKSDIKNPQNQVVMYKILEKFLRAIHPLMPFITEEIWQKINPDAGSIMINPWPHIQDNIIDKKVEKMMEKAFEAITTLRNMRSDMEIPVTASINAVISSPNKPDRELIHQLSSYIKALAKVSELTIEEKFSHRRSTITNVVGRMHITIPLEGIIDIEKEKVKLDERIEKAEAAVKSKENTLANQNFIKNAPAEIVEKEKEKLQELKDTLHKLKAVKDGLQ